MSLSDSERKTIVTRELKRKEVEEERMDDL